jgi:hypothetical protein
MIKVSKYYEENIIIYGGEKPGDYTAYKLGIKLSSDKELGTPEELEVHSNKLLEMSRGIIKKEIEKLKQGKG